MELLDTKTITLGCAEEPAPSWLDQMAPMIGMVMAITMLDALVGGMAGDALSQSNRLSKGGG